jgi:D-alanyl-D-alanine dipeptidase
MGLVQASSWARAALRIEVMTINARTRQPLDVSRSLASMVLWLVCSLAPVNPLYGGNEFTEMSDERLVNIEALIPGIRLDIRYATANNFTKRPLYPVARCNLRKQVAERLAKVQQELQAQGLGLKVFDCYRPLSIQKQLWALLPDERYVIDPRKGSRHNRGAAVDVTLVDAKGNELEMPTAYDDFSERAHRDYRLLPPSALRNRELLERIMTRHGFQGLATEWWHFDAEGWEQYPVLDQPLELLEEQTRS